MGELTSSWRIPTFFQTDGSPNFQFDSNKLQNWTELLTVEAENDIPPFLSPLLTPDLPVIPD